MSLDLTQLKEVRELAGGIVQARCPACAEGGHDRAGEHLRVYPDGRFGCCVYPKDREHRKRIFALAGDRKPRGFTVRVAAAPAAAKVPKSVAACLTAGFGTPGTPVSQSVPSAAEGLDDFGTLGTPLLMSRAYAREEKGVMGDDTHTCKDIETGVPSVPGSDGSEPAAEGGRLPYLNRSGDLMIPLDTPPRYRWWQGGQDIDVTRAEVLAWVAAERKESHGHDEPNGV